jgi:NAD(P)-dependent dehydrogenase (short-subunit alcohol dehydrogenase family)
LELKGRTALVTGGAVRVGRAISRALAAHGARVVVHFNSSGSAAEELVGEIRAAGGEAAAVGADLSSVHGVRKLIDAAEQPFGPIDVLINNASIFPPERLAEVDEDLWESTIAINLRAPFFLTQRLGGGMKSRGGGVIINLADLAGIQAWTGYAAHSISKAGLIHLTRIAARALAPEVRISAIAPGTVLPPEDLSEDEIQSLAARAPLQRNGGPEDVVQAVLYLIGAEFVTGEVMVVDGGRMLR